MEKWADYLISRVKYNMDKNHIYSVEVREDLGNNVGDPQIQKRLWVVSELESKKTFVTILKNKERRWTKGDEVHIIAINNQKFIRTGGNKKEEDNLGELPEF